MGTKLPEGWIESNLGDRRYFERYGGGTPKKSISKYWVDGTIPWLTNTEIYDNRINYVSGTKLKITKEALKNSSATLIPRNSVLLTCTASIGKVAISRIELATNQQFNSFKCNEKFILPEFLAYQLLSLKESIIKLGGGTTFGHINLRKLYSLRIIIPPLSVQKKIVAKLDAFFKEYEILKREKLKAKENYEKIYASALFKLLEKYKGSELVSLGELLDKGIIKEIKSGFPSGKHSRQGEIIHIRPMNINLKGRLDLSVCKYVEPESYKLDTYLLQEGDVIFNNTNSPELVGKTTYFEEQKKKCVYSNHMTRIRINRTKLNPKYLAIYLHNLWRQGFFKVICRSHVSQASVNNSMLKNVKICFPTIDEQNAIISQLNEISSPVELVNRDSKNIIERLEALPQSVLTKAFRGQLIV